MASIHLIGFINLLLLINPATAAMAYGYIGPTSTTVGSVGIQIMAPRPTRPPSIDENIGELRKRRLPDSIYSRIPASWCGFVNGDFSKSETHFVAPKSRYEKKSLHGLTFQEKTAP